MIRFQVENDLPVEAFLDILARSGLAERRPVSDWERLDGMVRHANLIVTARDAENRLVGVARSLTDYAYCCYLSDLAVDRDCQRQGIGKALIRHTQARLHPQATLLLLAAPAAKDYYGHIGFRALENAWCLDSVTSLR